MDRTQTARGNTPQRSITRRIPAFAQRLPTRWLAAGQASQVRSGGRSGGRHALTPVSPAAGRHPLGPPGAHDPCRDRLRPDPVPDRGRLDRPPDRRRRGCPGDGRRPRHDHDQPDSRTRHSFGVTVSVTVDRLAHDRRQIGSETFDRCRKTRDTVPRYGTRDLNLAEIEPGRRTSPAASAPPAFAARSGRTPKAKPARACTASGTCRASARPGQS